MKKPIDPNLNNLNDDDFLLNADDVKASVDRGFDMSDEFKRTKTDEPEFKVTIAEKGDDSNDYHASDKHHTPETGVLNESFITSQVGTQQSSGSSHHSSSSHHHSSSDSHHHSSSGSHHHSSGSHHHSSKKKMPVAAKIAIAVIAVILALIIGVVSAFFIMQKTGENDLKSANISENFDYEETIEYNGNTYKYNSDVVAIAFLGVDQRDLQTSDDTDFVGCADADIVVAVDTKTGTAKVISIPRDTLTDVDVYSNGQWVGTKQMQLCLAYAYGDGSSLSCENSVTSISRVLYNVPIEKYFALDLDGIAPLNDAIGGVTVNSLYDFPDYGIKTGDEITIKGDMAEAYVRTRDINGNLNASLDRTKRQMQYIKAYSSQLLPAVMKDFSVVSSLYNTASKYSQTNLTVNNATYLASLMLSKGTTDFDTYSLEGEMIEQDASDSDFPDAVYAQFVPDEDSLMQTVLDVFYNQVS